MAMHSHECLVPANETAPMTYQSGRVLAQSSMHKMVSHQDVVSEGMQGTFTSLAELVKAIEKCGIMSQELQKLCDRIGVKFEQPSIEETFNKIYKLFTEYQQMAESERRQRNEADAFCQQIRKRLNQTEEERVKDAVSIREKEQKLTQQTELVNKLEMNFRLAREQIKDMKETLPREYNEATKNTAEERRARLDAETKTIQVERARKQAESAYQEALIALDQQRTTCQLLKHENQQLKQHAVRLEQDKRQAEENFDEFCKAVEDICVDGDEQQLRALAALAKQKIELTRPLPTQASSVTTPTDLTSIDPTTTPEQQVGLMAADVLPMYNPENFSQTLLVPHPSHTMESASAVNLDPETRLQCQTYRSNGTMSSNDDICPERWQTQRHVSLRAKRPKCRATLPSSVVSGPGMLHARHSGHRYFAGLSPDRTELVISSESSDSATAEDRAVTESYRRHSYSTSTAGVNSYDYGRSSTPGSTDDYESVNYDSVNGMDGINLRHEQRDGVNLLGWVWQRRGRIAKSIRSGVSNAAQNGAKIAGNGWIWAALAAVTAGGVGMQGGGLSIGASDFSDSEDGSDSQDSPAQVNAFQG